MSRKRRRYDPRRLGRGSPFFKQLQDGTNTLSLRVNSTWQATAIYLKNNWIVVKACLYFGLCILVFMLLYSWLSDSSPIEAYTRHVTGATASILNIFDDNVHAYYPPGADPYVASSAQNRNIIGLECSGIIPMLILIAAVLAYPASIKRKAIGIIIGLIVLYIVNLIRTVTLFVIFSHMPGFFDVAHNIIWQAIMILLAVAIWLIWVSRLPGATKE